MNGSSVLHGDARIGPTCFFFLFVVLDDSHSLDEKCTGSRLGDDDVGDFGVHSLNQGDHGNDGGDGNDTIEGETGGDVLVGGEGDDLLYGGDDNDALHGTGGMDTLYGEAGDDVLNGGAEIDVLHGGTGFDEPEVLDDSEAGYTETGTWSDVATDAAFN